MPTQSVVRKANINDHQEIWRLFLQGHNENGIFKLAPEKVEFFLQRALQPHLIQPGDTGPRGEVAVIGDKKLEAIAFVIIGSFWYSMEMHLEELIVYVDPECRKTDHARSMIAWMKSKADELDIPLLTGVISTERTEAKLRLYDRLLPRVGGFYLYPLRDKDVKKRNHNMEHAAWQEAKQRAAG